MADRDVRVTYKTREKDSRTRIPTALDPYLYPDDRDELKRNVSLARVRSAPRYEAESIPDFDTMRRETIRDDVRSTAREGTRPATTKTTYSVTSAGLEKESEVQTRVPTQARAPTTVAPSSSLSQRPEYRDDRDYGRTSTVPPIASVRAPSRPYDDREYSRVEGVYDVERPRMENGVYVVDARDADIFVAGGGREAGRGFGGYRNDVYEDDYRNSQVRAMSMRGGDYRQSEAVYASRDDYRSSAPSIHSGAPYMSGARSERVPTAARSQTNLPSRSSTKVYEDDRATTTIARGPTRQSTRREEDDFAFVERRDTRAPTIRESFKDPFHDDGPPETPRGRTRASTFTKSPSDDEYVMVSPPQNRPSTRGRASSTGENLRSSLVTSDRYTAEERQDRRRSRSISFRAHEADDHYAGDRYHQPPGEEAANCGKFLKSYGGERSRDLVYSSRSDRRDDRELAYRSRSSKYDERDYDRRDSGRYSAQRSRSKSQRRRGSDDESYISTRLEKTKKTTYY